MLTKILIFLAVVIGVFVVARMGASSAFRPKSRVKKTNDARIPGAEDLVPCNFCGAFVTRGDPCTCRNASSS